MGPSSIYFETHLWNIFYLKLLCSFVLVRIINLFYIVSTIHSRTQRPCVFSGYEWYIVLQILCCFLFVVNDKRKKDKCNHKVYFAAPS